MTLPLRFVVCSYNLWTHERWAERRPALEAFIGRHQPDLLCLQELQADSRATLDSLLPGHKRIEDEFLGWEREGNIYWNTALFELVSYGAENIGIIEEYRRLFWARLKLLDDSGRTLLVSTAHYTWPGHRAELAAYQNIRLPQAQATLDALKRLAPENEPLLFMGDLNDHQHPIALLRAGGLLDAFQALGQPPRPTWPALPIAHGTATCIDWMFSRGPLRPMTIEVVDFYHGDTAPSDHKPLLATYGL